MVGVNGGKFPAIREHLDKNIGGVYKDMNLTWVALSSGEIADIHVSSLASRNTPRKARLTRKLVSSLLPIESVARSKPLFARQGCDRRAEAWRRGHYLHSRQCAISYYVHLIQCVTGSIGTHFPIALYAIERGLHVLITKPAVQKLEHHNILIEAAKKKGVVCWVEHHKR